ncbi:MAG TPA: serine hydroxymethyltransferase [Dehalococcoidia bacterium]|nr:serine hydroxymethyltransferase [Dehalococcoidia bacterium]
MPVNIADVQAIVDAQETWRGRQTINLIASENAQSPAVRAIQDSDFMARYAEGHPNVGDEVRRYYQGTRYIDQIENMARDELLALTRCRQADVRPISGNAANTAIALAYLRGGDPVIVNSTPAGGHISHNTIGVIGRRIQSRGYSLNLESPKPIPLHFYPLTEDGYHIDVAKSIDLIEQVSPRLIVLGKSLFLFPEPVRELSEVCRQKGIPVLYDGAHVFGLIVGGQFQDPWREGATWVTASTHKTFPGPQRGVIVSDLNDEDEARFWPAADRGVFPGSSSNHHLHSLPALLVAIREMQAHAQSYATQIVANAQALGKALDASGIAVEAKDFGYTRSHQIAVSVAAHGGGVPVAKRLEDNDIIVNYNLLPRDTDARHPSGLRIGVQEMTRYGMKEPQMQRLAELIAGAIKGSNVKAEVNALRAEFPELQFV